MLLLTGYVGIYGYVGMYRDIQGSVGMYRDISGLGLRNV